MKFILLTQPTVRDENITMRTQLSLTVVLWELRGLIL